MTEFGDYYVLGNSVGPTASEMCLMTFGVKPVLVPDGPPDVPKTDRGVRLMHS